MGNIEKQYLLPSSCIYFDKTFIEMFLEKSCIGHIFLAHWLFVMAAMEIIMRKKVRKCLKIIS